MRYQRRNHSPTVSAQVERMESRALLAADAALWFHDNNIGLNGGNTPDWEQTFTQPQEWQQTLRALDTYVVNDWMLLRLDAPAEAVPNVFLRDYFAPTLTEHHVNLAIDSGAATWLGHHRQRFNATTEQILQPYGDLIQRLRSYGARLDRVSLKGVLAQPLIVDGQEVAYPMAQRISDAVEYAKYMTGRFPDLRIGILDTLPTWNLEYRGPYGQLLDDLAAEGIKLDHIHLEMPANLADGNVNQFSWDKAVDVQAYVQQELNVRFGATLTSLLGQTSGQLYHENTLAGLNSYRAAIARSNYPLEDPDHFVVISWYPNPGYSLPENPGPIDPAAYTTTRTALALAELLDDNFEQRHIRPIAAESRTSGDGVDAWNLVNGSGLLDRQNLPLPRHQWVSAPGADPNEWITVQFCQQHTLDALHVWNFNTTNPGPDAHGVSVADIYTSLSGVGNPVDNPSQWTWAGQYNIQKAESAIGAADPGQFIDLPNRPAVAAAMVLRQNYGGAQFGLGELRFLEATDIVSPGNASPWFAPVSDIVIPANARNYEVILQGITAGCGDNQALRVSAISDNSSVVPQPRVEYASPNEAGLVWLDAANSVGTANITVTVEDGGLDGNLQTTSDNGTFSRTFRVTVQGQPLDFGDAPAPYQTLLTENGARHLAIGPLLGDQRDAESDALTGVSGDGHDEDGVQFGSLSPGAIDTTMQVRVTEASQGAYLNGWIDFDGDGLWSGPWEQVVHNAFLSSGDHTIRFDVPGWVTTGPIWARVRLSTAPDLTPTGPASDGEVEDYRLFVEPPVPVHDKYAEHIVRTDALGARSVFAADVDSDGDTDLLSVSDLNHDISWYENDGQHNFTRRAIGSAHFAIALFPIDMEGDGDLDVIIAGFGGNNSGALGRVSWFENDGQQNFTARTIEATAGGPHGLFAADVDSDGDVDVLVASSDHNNIAWYENNGQQHFTGRLIDSNTSRPRSVHAIDIDADGDLDVLAASQDDNTVAWYENNGSQNFTKRVIDDEALGTQNAFPVDIDSDGDIDIVAGWLTGSAIAWYENRGNGAFTRRFVDPQDKAKHVSAGDFDGDGDVDVLAAGLAGGRTAVYVNDGSERFQQQLVTELTPSAQWAFPFDIDQDGDTDFATAAHSSNRISWHEVNALPTAAEVPDIVVREDAPVSAFELHGITAGGTEQQALRLSVDSENNDLFEVLYAQYNSTSDRHELIVQPNHNAVGTVSVVLTVEDSGLDGNLSTVADNAAITRRFQIQIVPVNDPPTLAPIQDLNIQRGSNTQTVDLTGISSGSGETQAIRVAAFSDNTALIPHPSVAYTSPQSTGNLSLTPNGLATGVSTITVVIEDAGLDGLLSTAADNEFTQRAFQVTVTASPPVITEPVGRIESVRPTLLWEAVPGTDHYEVWLELIGGSANPVANPTVTGTSYTLTSDLEIGRYRTWVRAHLTGGGTTVWATAEFQVSVPVSVAPLPFHGVDRRPLISWSPVHGATSYRVYIDNWTAGGIVVADEIVSTNGFRPAEDFGFGRHQIWVRAIGAGNYAAAWSPATGYYIGPDLLTPKSSTFNTTPIFNWETLPGIDSFQLYVSRGSSVVVNQSGLQANSYAPPAPLEIGNYRWWIRPFHTSGRSGAWSELATFSVGGQPILTGPLTASTDGFVLVEWEPVDGAGEYEIYVFHDDGLGLQQRTNDISAPTFDTYPLPDGNYRVWVKSYESNGQPGRWSRPFTFEVSAVNSAVTATPNTAQAVTFDTMPTLAWTHDGSPVAYDLYLTNEQRSIRKSSLSSPAWTADEVLDPGVWKWWVRAQDTNGDWGPWSDMASVDTSGRALLLGPIGTTQDRTPTIQWTTVDGAGQYIFQLDNLSTGDNGIIRDDQVGATSFTPSTDLAPGNYRAWVRAISADGIQQGPWSLRLEFTVAAASGTESIQGPLLSLIAKREEGEDTSTSPPVHQATNAEQAPDSARKKEAQTTVPRDGRYRPTPLTVEADRIADHQIYDTIYSEAGLLADVLSAVAK